MARTSPAVEPFKNFHLVLITEPDALIFNNYFNRGLLDLLVSDAAFHADIRVDKAVLNSILEQDKEHLGKSAPVILEKTRLNFLVNRGVYEDFLLLC